MSKRIIRYSIVFIILIFSSLSSSATTLTVSNINDSGAGSLRQAVLDAISGDTIVFSVTGTITLTSGQIVINKNLTILGPGETNLAIDGNNTSGIFNVTSGTIINIASVTIQNGNTGCCTGGAGIYNRGILTVTNTTIVGNAGGGILNTSSTATINNSTLSYNTGSTQGGGIYSVNNSKVTINNSTLSYNTASQGAAIFSAINSEVTINNSTFSNNTGSSQGGAIYDTHRLTINNSTFSKNRSSNGAIYLSGGTTTINNSTFSENYATNTGGAIYLSGGTLTLSNSIVSGNSARFSGNECNIASGTFNNDANNIFGVNNSRGGCTKGASDIVPAAGVNIGDILNPLADNDAPTQTHALVVGSLAIDAANLGAIATDQRGVTTQNGTRDIGAFEYGANPIYPIVQFTSAGVTYDESDGTVNIDLTISGAVNFGGIAEVYVIDALSGSAISGADYTVFPFTTLSIDCSSGTCPASVTVPLTLLTDAVFENDEIVDLEIFGTNVFASIGTQSTFVATIQATTVVISANNPSASEAPLTNGQFTADLSTVNNTGSAITVNYSVSGTATNGVDYTTLSGSVDIANGQQTATIDGVPIVDALFEGNEMLDLTLTSTSHANISVDASPATVTISDSATAFTAIITATDPDAAEAPLDKGQFTVDLGIINNTGSAITVNYSVSGTATNGADYTTLSGTVDVADGQQTATIDVIPFNDSLPEFNESVELTLTSTNNANVSADTTSAIVTIESEDRQPDDSSQTTNIDSDDRQFDDLPQITNINSDTFWSIKISTYQSFIQSGDTVVFTIEILKLRGGTPVTMAFPLSDLFTIQSVSSNRGAASVAGQNVIFSDDIHVGDTPVITVTTILGATLSPPFTETVQTCITSPTTLCTSITLAQIVELPSTGEIPIWRTPIILLLALSGFLILGGAGTVLLRRVR